MSRNLPHSPELYTVLDEQKGSPAEASGSRPPLSSHPSPKNIDLVPFPVSLLTCTTLDGTAEQDTGLFLVVSVLPPRTQPCSDFISDGSNMSVAPCTVAPPDSSVHRTLQARILN